MDDIYDLPPSEWQRLSPLPGLTNVIRGVLTREISSLVLDYLQDQFMPPPVDFLQWVLGFFTSPPSDWLDAYNGGFEFDLPSGWTLQQQCSFIDALFLYTGHASLSGSGTFGPFNNPVCSGPSTTNINNRTAATFAADLATTGPANVGRLIFTQQKPVSSTSKQWAPWVYAYRTKTGGVASGPDPAGDTFFAPKKVSWPHAAVPLSFRLDPMVNPIGRVGVYPPFTGLLGPGPYGQRHRPEARESGYSQPALGRKGAVSPLLRAMDFGAGPPLGPRRDVLGKPGRRQPAGTAAERKFGALNAGPLMAALRAALAATEALDALECLFGSLPAAARKGARSPFAKAKRIATHFSALDVPGALECLILNHYVDGVIGQISRANDARFGLGITRKLL